MAFCQNKDVIHIHVLKGCLKRKFKKVLIVNIFWVVKGREKGICVFSWFCGVLLNDNGISKLTRLTVLCGTIAPSGNNM
jgi:hypothetical protein